jgi:hypothetical protein
MDAVKKLIELIYYYQKDQNAGKPYWKDPVVVSLIVSFAATELMKYAGIHVDADLQLKIVGVVTGIGALFSPHTGVVARPPAKVDPAHNLGSLS